MSPKFPIRPEFIELALGLAVAFLLLAWTRGHPLWLANCGRLARRLARRKSLSILAAAFLGPSIRLAILPLAPIPEPVIHDEFVHLLVADTLRHGRLANPPLPFPDHFETIYVLERPTYAASYPLGNGAFLAFGWILTGCPWFGVWLAMVLCCGLVAWCQYRFNPPLTAFAGGLLFSLLFGISSLWMNTYWGGAVAGAGGALVFGALPALIRTSRICPAFLAAIGWTLVWFTRPYESVMVGIVVAAVVLARLARGRRDNRRNLRNSITRVIVLGLAVIAGAGVSCYQNWRVTGDPLLLPYQATQQRYGVPQGLVWQHELPPPQHVNAQQMAVYLWQRDRFRQSLSLPNRLLNAKRFWAFYVGYPLSIPLLLGLLGWRSRKSRLLILILAAAFIWSSLYFDSVPHYLAPAAAVLIALVMRGFAMLSRWRPRSGAWPVGACLAIGLWLAAALAGLRILHPFLLTGHPAPWSPRVAISLRLRAEPGMHLVFVHHSASDNAHVPWVYNGAQLEGAKVVWANDLGPERNRPLIDYLEGRRLWIVDTDEGILKPYAP